MQDLLTATADHLAVQSGFIRRRRKVTGANFAQAVVVAALADADTTAGRAADLGAALAAAAPPRGRLALADLNFFDTAKFARWDRAGAYFLSRRKVRTAVSDAGGRRLDLLRTLRVIGAGDLDRDVRL